MRMALFQKAPKTPEEAKSFEPLEISPDQVLEMSEEEWYETIYRGDSVPQLTVRATIMGSILGFLLAFTNLYVGLKTGWGLGVAITACILSYAVWNFFLQSGVAKSPMTVLENNCMQSTASAAGYSTGGTMVSAIAAMLLMTSTVENPGGEHMKTWILVLWTAFLAVFGTCLAVPMKRNMINKERLKFPSGTAAAVTLQGLYSHGENAIRKARALFWTMGIGAIFPALIELKVRTVEGVKSALLPAELHIFDWFSAPGTHVVPDTEAGGSMTKTVAYKPSDWTWVWDVNPVMIAAGALVGLRIGLYMLFGGILLVYGIGLDALRDIWLSPLGEAWSGILSAAEQGADVAALGGMADELATQFAGASDSVAKIKALGTGTEWADMAEGFVSEETRGAITKPGKAWKEAGLWLGVPIMLSYGLLQFATQWKTILRAFTSFKDSSSSESGNAAYETKVAETEVPGSWFGLGTALAGSGLVWLAWYAFSIPPHFALLAIVMTFFLALVAARATGESDITPVGAMGKIMQLTFGTIMPQSATANLMSASITANGAGCTADLLNDLKSGYLLGADPRRQFMAQLLGILAGTAATVTGFYLMVPDASVMTGDIIVNGVVTGTEPPDFPAPSAQVWLAVAKLMTGGGISAMHPMHRVLVGWGLGIGMLCLILEMASPKKWKAWMPSATGIGLGLILPFQYPLSMALGAIIAYCWTKKNKESADEYMIPAAAGLIAGISIMGVVVASLNTVLAA